MAKDKFQVTFSTIAGSSVGNLIKVLRRQKVEAKYIPRLILSSLVSLFAEPFRWYEHLRYDKKVDNYELKEDPVFILGHWRSGTTLLHNLLCEDPATGYVDTYQGIFPDLLLGSQWLFKNFMKVSMPKTRPSDNMKLSVDFPQEEEFAIGCVNPHGYYNFWFFPNSTRALYDETVRFNGLTEKEKEKWREDYISLAKKALMNTGGTRFISKNPPHTGRIKMILEMFPKARFIYIYRNPVTVFTSTKRLVVKTMPGLKFQDIPESEIEDNIFYIYERMIKEYMEEKSLIPPENLIEIRFEDFEKDPVSHLDSIYSKLRFVNSFESVKPLFEKYMKGQKGYKKNTYEMQESQLEQIKEHWGFAMEQWDYKVPDNISIIGSKEAVLND